MSNSTIPSTIAVLNSTKSNSIFAIGLPLIGLVWFETIGAVIAYGLGFIGNVLSLLIFCSQKEFRNISTGLLFIFIAISNFFHLCTLAIEFLTIYNVSVFRHVFFQCSLNLFIQNISRAMSTYFMVTIAIDRLIRTELPMRSKKICTKQNTILLTCIYLIIFALFWSFFLFPYMIQNPISGSCSFRGGPAFTYFTGYLHVPIRAVFLCFIPVLVMLGANLRMLRNIRDSRMRVTNISTVPSSGTTMPVTTTSNSQGKKFRRMSALDRMLYYMMVANVTIFIITQIPFHTYACIRNNISGIDTTTNSLIRAITLIWSSLYFGIAFYFYCLASPLFREKFIKLARKIFTNQTILHSTSGSATAMG